MKSRLFWKILPGFLIAVILILYSVWTAIVLTSDDYLSSERESARILAIYQLSAAQLAIESGGIAKFKELSQGWEAQDSDPRSGRNYWNRLSVVETKRVIDSEEATNGRRDFVVVYAIDPESKKWAVRYKLPPDTPPESWSITDAFPSILTIEWVIPGLLGGLLFSAILVWYVNRPIQRLRNGFRKLAEGQLSTRLGPAMGRRRDEIADLANDFDRMAERLQQLVLARDQLLHDVSHELRSPLARLNLAVVLAGRDAAAPRAPLQRIESEVERLDGLVGELLSLSRGESDESERDDYFDMRALVDAVVDDATFEAQYRGVSMVARIEPEQHTLMQGSAKLVRRAIENIIRNAIQFSAQGDAVEVSLSVDGELNQVMLLIADRGPGVPEADLLRMQEPFVRLQNGLDRQGYGLGLAIARRAVQCHKGALVAANRAGGGLVVTVTLPLMNMVLHVADCIVEKEE